jgi:hypothetical protein
VEALQAYSLKLTPIKRQAVILTARSLFLLFLLFHLDDFSTLIVAAAWAHAVGKPHLTAVWALNQVLVFQGIM